MATTALLRVDMINLFDFKGGPAWARAASALAKRLQPVKARLKVAGVPVIYVNDNFANWQADFYQLVWRCAPRPATPAPTSPSG